MNVRSNSLLERLLLLLALFAETGIYSIQASIRVLSTNFVTSELSNRDQCT